MAQRRNNLKFNNIRLPKSLNSVWVEITNTIFNKLRYEKKFFKFNEQDEKSSILFKNFKEIGNYLFKQNEYKNAKDLYAISLIFIPDCRIIERSLNFSNRAQCSIFLGGKIQSLSDCISALKLYLRHDKSWYRKVFVNKGCRDYINCTQILFIVQSLSVRFVRKHVCTQTEFYGKNLIRLGNVSFKKKRNREIFYGNDIIYFLPTQIELIKQKKDFIIILDLISSITLISYFLAGYFFSFSKVKNLLNLKNNSDIRITLIFRYNWKKLKISFLKIYNFLKILIHNSTLFGLINKI